MGSMTVGPRIKMVLGALLGFLGVWWYIPGGGMNTLMIVHTPTVLTNLESLIAQFQGTVGILAIIIGLFVVWIEHDELKMRRELESEEFGRRLQHSVQAVAEGGEDPEAEDTEAPDDVEDTGGSDGDEVHTCDACDRSFDTERGLNVHRSQVHED